MDDYDKFNLLIDIDRNNAQRYNVFNNGLNL